MNVPPSVGLRVAQLPGKPIGSAEANRFAYSQRPRRADGELFEASYSLRPQTLGAPENARPDVSGIALQHLSYTSRIVSSLAAG
jgi:hypothetical protein